LMIHYHIHKNAPLVPTMCQMNEVHTPSPYHSKSYLILPFYHLSVRSGPSCFLTYILHKPIYTQFTHSNST
jgi:hypothetical protein